MQKRREKFIFEKNTTTYRQRKTAKNNEKNRFRIHGFE